MALRAAWLRGGTSKGLFFKLTDLPLQAQEELPGLLRGDPPSPASTLNNILASSLGSPDRYGMQLNGVGGGISSTSKVAIVNPSKRADCDVDYIFAQVDMLTGAVDWSGSCGNLGAAVGLFARDEGMVRETPEPELRQDTIVDLWQANLGYKMRVTVPDRRSPPDTRIPGVDAVGQGIRVEFVEPRVGNLKLLPTGNAIDRMILPCGAFIDATVVCGANPAVFVSAVDAGLPRHGGIPLFDTELATTIDSLRAQGAELMGIPLTDAVRVSFVSPGGDGSGYTASDGQSVGSDEVDLVGCISTPGRVHHAFTGTGAINLACACCIPGSVASRMLASGTATVANVRLGHPGGVMVVQASCVEETDEAGAMAWKVVTAGFVRTARYLMSGTVHLP